MLHPLPLVCIAIVCGLPVVGEAAAQSRAPASVEASLGFRSGHGGSYVNRGGGALDLVLAYPLRGASAGALIGGLNVGAQSQLVGLAVCLILPDGGCAPDFPTFYSIGALAGVQRGSARAFSARVLAGPVYFHAHEGGRALGMQSRVDMATPSWQRAAVVVSLRCSALPSFRGEAVGISSFGVGLRIR
jgi:hypothetical protein